MSKSTVFLSYRRNPDEDLATNLYEKMTSWGLDVFWDIEKLGGGRFDLALEREIITRDAFMVILSPHTLESEWVRKEIALALRHEKQIIPILANGFDFYQASLPSELDDLQRINGIPYSAATRERALRLLKARLGVQQRRLWILPALVLVVFLLGGGLAFSQLSNNAISDAPASPPTTEVSATSETQPTRNETGFPCEGEIIFSSGGLLNQVRSLPNNSAMNMPPVQQGSTVTISNQRVDGRSTWYAIEYGENSGWIRDLYVTLSDDCP